MALADLAGLNQGSRGVSPGEVYQGDQSILGFGAEAHGLAMVNCHSASQTTLGGSEISMAVNWLRQKPPIQSEAGAYLCEMGHCCV